MSKDPKEGGVCWNCRAQVAAEDNFCRFCGRNLVSFPWYYQHWGIIVLTFTALGPFSLILVWRSPVISRMARWVYTVLAVLMTYELVVGCYHAYVLLNNSVSSLLKGQIPPGLGL
ncbi:MAG: zinc-ribbon domain-containing protein [Elusimicrobia bacterium]|nr:zinc-ribbon domain-containing protein [Elusimicrobiota bacterium]